MGRLEKPDASAAGIGKRPLLVAEEFRLGQMLGNGGAIDLHPRPVSPRAFAMDPTGQRSLAGAGLAFDEHRRQLGLHPAIGRENPLNLRLET